LNITLCRRRSVALILEVRVVVLSSNFSSDPVNVVVVCSYFRKLLQLRVLLVQKFSKHWAQFDVVDLFLNSSFTQDLFKFVLSDSKCDLRGGMIVDVVKTLKDLLTYVVV